MLAINKGHFRKKIEITMWQKIKKEIGIYMCTAKNQAIKKEICLKMSLFCTLCSLLKSSLISQVYQITKVAQ